MMLQFSFGRIAALVAIAPSLITASPITGLVTISTTSTSTSASSTGTTATSSPSALSCPASDGQTVTVGADDFTIHCGVDYYGGDLTMSWETSLENCISTCESTTGCIIVSYSGQACYMKNVNNGPQANSNVWAAVKVVASFSSTSSSLSSTSSSTTATTPTATVVCPASDGSTYTAADGAIFNIECSADRYGSDLDIAWVSDFASCIEACDATAGCVDVSYRLGTPGPCYMKNSAEQAVRTDSGVWGAVRASTVSSSTVSSSTASSTSSAASSSSAPSSLSSVVSSTTSSISSPSSISSASSSSMSSSSTSSSLTSTTTSSTSSATPTPTTVGCGLISNPSFETVPSATLDWALISKTQSGGPLPVYSPHFSVGTSVAKAGSFVAYTATYLAGEYVTFGNTIQQLTAGIDYTVSFWKRQNIYGKVVVAVDGVNVLTTPAVSDTAWYQSSVSFTATSSTAALTITTSSISGSNGFEFDAFTIAPVSVYCSAGT